MKYIRCSMFVKGATGPRPCWNEAAYWGLKSGPMCARHAIMNMDLREQFRKITQEEAWRLVREYTRYQPCICDYEAQRVGERQT